MALSASTALTVWPSGLLPKDPADVGDLLQVEGRVLGLEVDDLPADRRGQATAALDIL
jgi:hypothetical protein